MYLGLPCECDWREHEEFFSRKISVQSKIYTEKYFLNNFRPSLEQFRIAFR
jgi:hypothetical protein